MNNFMFESSQWGGVGTQAGQWIKDVSSNRGLIFVTVAALQAVTTSTPDLESLKIAESCAYTSAGYNSEKIVSDSGTIRDLKAISGLTWQQLASLFEVSRRTVHFWDRGNPMNSKNSEKLERILGEMRTFGSRHPAVNRKALMSSRYGELPFDLLKKGSLEAFRQAFYADGFSVRGEELKDRPSLVEPMILANAVNEKAHEEKPTRRKVKVRKIKKS